MIPRLDGRRELERAGVGLVGLAFDPQTPEVGERFTLVAPGSVAETTASGSWRSDGPEASSFLEGGQG